MNVESKVGLFVVIGMVFLFFLSTQVNNFATFGTKGYVIDAYVDDATGVENHAKVKMNGVNIGFIQEIILDRQRVILKLFINEDIKIPINSSMVLAQESLLSSKIINIMPGDSSVNIEEKGSIDNYHKMASFDQTSDSVDQAAKKFALLVDDFRAIVDKESQKDLKQTFKEFRELGSNLNGVVLENKNNLRLLISEFKDLGLSLNDIVAQNQNNLRLAIINLRNMGMDISTTSNKFGVTADTINQKLPNIMTKLDSLSNSFDKVGKDLNVKLPIVLDKFIVLEDDFKDILAENRKPLNNALNSADEFFATGGDTFKKVDKYLASVTQSELQFGMRSEYQLDDSYNKSYVSINYLPNPFSYYLLDIVLMKDYSRFTDSTKSTIHLPTKFDDPRLLISAQYGKRYNNLLVRAGIIESTGGAGVDYFMYRDNVKLSFDAFDFNSRNDLRGDKAHLKADIRYRFFKHLEIKAGIDNFLNKDATNSFIGFGASFVDDDLKLLLSSAASSF
jgi:phospholipid/cholesterol/gamma-HCH transport system substrate-binding protein